DELGTYDQIWMNRYSAVGAWLDPAPIRIAWNNAVSEKAPSVSMDDIGKAVVAYQTSTGSVSGTSSIVAKRVNAASWSTENEITLKVVVGTSYLANPSVALSHTGGAFVVAYEYNWFDSFHVLQPGYVQVKEVSSTDQIVGSYGYSYRTAPAVSID